MQCRVGRCVAPSADTIHRVVESVDAEATERPGGRIVVPFWTLDYYGMLFALTVAEDGTAARHFVDDVSFMVLRDRRTHPRYQVFCYTGEEHEQATVTETGISPRRSGSWARLYYDYDSHGPYPVYRYGPRQLWDMARA